MKSVQRFLYRDLLPNETELSQVIEMAQEQFSHSWMEKWTNQVPENGHKNVTSMS